MRQTEKTPTFGFQHTYGCWNILLQSSPSTHDDGCVDGALSTPATVFGAVAVALVASTGVATGVMPPLVRNEFEPARYPIGTGLAGILAGVFRGGVGVGRGVGHGVGTGLPAPTQYLRKKSDTHPRERDDDERSLEVVVKSVVLARRRRERPGVAAATSSALLSLSTARPSLAPSLMVTPVEDTHCCLSETLE